jgi:cyclopropane fatty-acyl-phospholipid synthase-like methyltransferase
MLVNILRAAGLASNDATQDSVAVLDVGFGCGDQTVALAELIQAPSRPQFRYVGLTLNETQRQAAQQRLDASSFSIDKARVQLFQADAAKPESWDKAITTAVDNLSDESYSERWLLGLDCLYHFSPSRKLQACISETRSKRHGI